MESCIVNNSFLPPWVRFSRWWSGIIVCCCSISKAMSGAWWVQILYKYCTKITGQVSWLENGKLCDYWKVQQKMEFFCWKYMAYNMHNSWLFKNGSLWRVHRKCIYMFTISTEIHCYARIWLAFLAISVAPSNREKVVFQVMWTPSGWSTFACLHSN